MAVELAGKSIKNLLPAFRSEGTKEDYLIDLKLFFEFCRIDADSFVALAKKNPSKAEGLVVSYIQSRKDQVSGSTIRNFRGALKLFLSMNDTDKLNWTRIGKIIPPARKHGSDRAPTLDEVKKILENCDLRMKCIVLTLLSSGIRIGAFEWLKWRDVEPVEFGNYKFTKLTVYRGENEEYYTFVTPECYKHLLEYKALRGQAGEKVGPNSPLIRDDWGNYKGAKDPTRAEAVTPKSLRNGLGKLYKRIGLRNANDDSQYEFKQAHGFRKFFKSITERYVKSIYVELLMGHSTGVSDSYMKPSHQDMVQEYSKAIPALTILSREEVTKDDIEKVRKEAALEAMRAVATSFGIDAMKIRIEKQKELGRELTRDEELQTIQMEIAKIRQPNGNGKPYSSRIVDEKELPQSIEEGWEIVRELKDGKFLVKRANHVT